MQYKVQISGVDTSSLKVLKNEEMDELLRRAGRGDAGAREKLIQGNLRLVLSVVQRFAHRGENPDDLFQVGCIGLMKAIDHFDQKRIGTIRFSTYGCPLIVGEVRRFLRDNSSTIRVSRSMRDTAYRVLQAKERYMAENQREPTLDQLSSILGVRREEIVVALDAIAEPVSLYEPIYSDGGDEVCIMDQVQDRRNTDDMWLNRMALKEAISHLTEREKKILRMRYFQDRTQVEVSGEIGISQAQVSRLEKNAIARLRSEM